MTYSEIAAKIVELIGTNDNVVSIMSCMTRLRVETVDPHRVDVVGLQQVEKVKGVTLKGNTVQIVLLGELKKVYDEVEKITTTKDIVVKKSFIDGLLDFLSGTFVPIIPALIGCGVLQGILMIVDTFGWLDPASSTHQILTLMSNLGVYFFPIFIAISASKKVRCNTFLAVMIAGFLIHPTFLEWVSSGTQYMNFFGLPMRLNNYTSSVLPVLLSIWVIKYVELFAEKISPKVVRSLLVPLIVLLIATPICMGITAPLGSYISDGFAIVMDFLQTQVPALAGLVIGAFASVFVMTGLHMVLIAFIMMNLAIVASDFIKPILAISNIVVGSIALAAFFQLNNKEEKGYALSAAILGMGCGLSEPSLYGVVLKYKRPLVPMIFTGSIEGLLSVVLGVRTTAVIQGPFILTLPTYAGCIIQVLVCLAVAVGLAIVSTLLWGVEKPGLIPQMFARKKAEK